MGERDQRVNGLLVELGRQIATRWLTTLLIPGLLWVCVAVPACQLGWAHALDPHAAEPLLRWFVSRRPAGQNIALAVAVLMAALGVGMTATGVPAILRLLRPVAARSAPARRLRTARLARWERARRAAEHLEAEALRAADGSTIVGPQIAQARARQYAISLEEPAHATWVGDRLRANMLRIHRGYGLDVALVWPRLWVILPDSLRADISAVQNSYAAAGVTVGWAVLYAALGLVWGPALLIAVAVLAVAFVRARSATEVLCQLVEAATDLYASALADQLHIPCTGVLTPDLGHLVNEVLRKEPPQNPSRFTPRPP
ncbi:hypothetical protein ABZS83_19940 [Streptomyces sp. NPDC005426]|uniref:hypothetical protein n=1 Tax=Streptomyces sp. NPDC005426 TaxID=3155344 RepID=UPI0033B89084